MNRTPVIVGAVDYPLTGGVVEPGITALHMQAASAADALRMAGLTFADVDGLFTAGTWSLAGAGQHPTMTLGEYMRITPRYLDSTNIGGASFEAHLGHAAAAIADGRCDVALITYGSTQRSDSSRNLGGRRPEHNFQFETPWGMPSPLGGYALAAARYEHEFGLARDALSRVAVAARDWARLNPRATKRDPLTVDDVSSSKLVSDPLRLLDCCLVTDGGGAVVVTAESLAQGEHRPIAVTGYGESQSHWIMSEMPDLTRVPAYSSGPTALAMSGRTLQQIDVVEIYDSFTITVLLTLEALGFCGRGEAADFVRSHDLGPGGDFPLNTSGGGLSYLHPGMFGIFLITEACRQLWGRAGAAQVANARTALISGTGGAMSSAATCVL